MHSSYDISQYAVNGVETYEINGEKFFSLRLDDGSCERDLHANLIKNHIYVILKVLYAAGILEQMEDENGKEDTIEEMIGSLIPDFKYYDDAEDEDDDETTDRNFDLKEELIYLLQTN